MNKLLNAIQFEAIHNFRDMGGYKSKDGRTVKEGVLFRSGELGNMKEVDLEKLQQLSLHTIFDYRDEVEAQTNVTPLIGGVNNIRIPAQKQNETQTAAMKEILKNEAFSNIDEHSFTLFYVELPINNASYKKLVEIFVEGKGPLLHHCTAGKDRTGVGAAIILMILDIPIETIIEDYLKTNEFLQESTPKWLEKMKVIIQDDETVAILASCREIYIQSAYNSILSVYGSVDAYLLEEFGIDAGVREKVKSHYLV
ncbi:tyrosine-protein phosphatase [Psychrobacillus sp. FSL H8-0483]|uniref:tyrosine-protein phosphatase n=1 Tax=Psychrobacillus sp. FSL H8-0483 TaxID=2921389 RepID=UPI00315B3EB7